MDDAMLQGLQQMIDTERTGQTWLNSVPVVDGLLGELQQVAWKARVQEAMGKIDAGARDYKIAAKVSELVQIFDGRHPGYAALPWNTDPGQMKTHIATRHDYWGEGDEPAIDEALPRLLDCCAGAAMLAVESQLPDYPSMFKQSLDEAMADVEEQRHLAGCYLMGIPQEVYVSIVVQKSGIDSKNGVLSP